jgi:hypothetical protein
MLRRVIRLAFALLAALSAAALLAVLVLWPISGGRVRGLERITYISAGECTLASGRTGVVVEEGRLYLFHSGGGTNDAPDSARWSTAYLPSYGADWQYRTFSADRASATTGFFNAAGVSGERTAFDGFSDAFVGLPLPYVALFTAILPMTWLQTWRRRRRRTLRAAAGLCLRCGYDLRATAGRCPECGVAASAPPSRSNDGSSSRSAGRSSCSPCWASSCPSSPPRPSFSWPPPASSARRNAAGSGS